MGKLIALDGLDASGKETQTNLLCGYFDNNGIDYRSLSFPTYDERYSLFVKMYLSGEFGNQPNDVNAYAASGFFAMDRFSSYLLDWKKDYDEGKLILTNRYTTANAVHQLSKLPRQEWDGFLEWLWDYEFTRLTLPKPDLVLYLCMPVEVALKLLSHRCEETGAKKDIHESHPEHLYASYEAAQYAAKVLGWHKIDCAVNGEPRSREDIHSQITEIVKKSQVV